MKIAIYGLSATGKTAIATILATALGYDIRSCGEEVKARTKTLELQSPSALSLSAHEEIDTETRSIAFTPDVDIVIEGRYLNYVLDGHEQIIFVELACSDEVRESRIFNKTIGTKDSITNRDDECLRHKLKFYGSSKPNLKHSILIDTTELTIEQCVQRIIEKTKDFT